MSSMHSHFKLLHCIRIRSVKCNNGTQLYESVDSYIWHIRHLFTFSDYWLVMCSQVLPMLSFNSSSKCEHYILLFYCFMTDTQGVTLNCNRSVFKMTTIFIYFYMNLLFLIFFITNCKYCHQFIYTLLYL